jgi:hypothetical protein
VYVYVAFVASSPLLTFLSVLELCRPPDLNEARVRKCILALSGAKIVKSDNSTVRVSYVVPSYGSDFDVRERYCINGLVHQILDDLALRVVKRRGLGGNHSSGHWISMR